LFGFRSDLNGNDWHLLIGAGPPFFDPARAIIVSNGGDGVGSIAVHGHNVFIAGNDYLGQIWRSLDDGDHWANDWPPGAGAFVPVTGLSLFDSPVSTRVLVGLNRVGSAEYWQSIDNGTTWGPIPGLSTAGGYMRNVVVLPAGPDSTYFAGTEGLVWRTRDFVNWTAESDGLPGSSDLGLNILATSGPVFSGTTGLTSYLFAGTKNGVFRTAANTTGWEKFSSGLTAPNVHALVVIGNTVFAGTDAGVWKSALN
jgi:hypothetical protein